MMRSIIFVVCILLCGHVSTAQKINFTRESYKNALDRAEKEGLFVFIDFYATWCGPCKVLERDVFSNSEVGLYYNEHFVCLQVDVDKEKGLARKYQIRAMPTLVFVDSKGKETRRISGVVSPERLVHIGQEVRGERPTYEELYKQYQAKPEDWGIAQSLLLETPAYVQEAGKSGMMWQKRAFKIFQAYVQGKGLENMINDKDFQILMLYQENPVRADSILNFVNSRAKDFEQVVTSQQVWEFVISRQNRLVNLLAQKGDLAYREELERIKGDMQYVYGQIQHPKLTVFEAMKLQADGYYALYAEKNEGKYLDLQESYFTSMGDQLSFKDYQQAISTLIRARNGNLAKSSCERCIEWLGFASGLNLQPKEQLDLSCLMGSCFRDLNDFEKAKACFNQAYVLAMQVGDERMQAQIKAMLGQL